MGRRYLEIDSHAGKMTLRIEHEDENTFTVVGRFYHDLGGTVGGCGFGTQTLRKENIKNYRVIDGEGKIIA